MEKDAIGKKLDERYPNGAPLAVLILERSRLEGKSITIFGEGEPIVIPPDPPEDKEEKTN